ncbi:hypothetical protein G4Y73_00210 [Wenzhouxiangella sp. XN201]|uniref:hypothetical protein n=1 Tax=Wenzhouxiangella sp. XN201 TaxID=2710755 RepID=UPI0013C71AAB|nr:hypothetical protein [Wenzhouxiangella sp. XN201]NEZ02566.1 hypothetical protein [Wenzhouxiangella sp. XN201]
MLMIDYNKLSWWYWLVTACLLTLGVGGYPLAFPLAIALTLIQLVHYLAREKNFSAFPIQVRAWYLGLLLVALPAPLQPVYWIPTIGTWALVLFGYCGMARIISLLPWNRRQPLSMSLVKKTFLSRPVRGSFQDVSSRAS